jgi:hypothetical protein
MFFVIFMRLYFPELLALAAGNRVDNLKTRYILKEYLRMVYFGKS